MIDTVGVLVASLTDIQIDRDVWLVSSRGTIVVIREPREML